MNQKCPKIPPLEQKCDNLDKYPPNIKILHELIPLIRGN